LIITDLITNAWLPQTERAVYELSGRLSQAGISPMDSPVSYPQADVFAASDLGLPSASEPALVLQAQATLATDVPVEPVIVNRTGQSEVKIAPVPRPIPLSSSISRDRSAQLDKAIAELTSTAQQIVLKTLSLSGLSGGLSALTYVSLTPGSFYEAGTIVALGTAYALWRMQGDWHKATKALEDGLLDEGRVLIQRIVGRMRQLVENGSRVVEDEVELETRRQAQMAVEKARTELNRLEK
jgi:hypothetical protein